MRRRPGARAPPWCSGPHNTPTLETYADNGDEMIVRDLRLEQADGRYHLVSAPTSALENRVKRTRLLGDIVFRGTRDVDARTAAYDLTCELMWGPASAPANLGLELCRAPGGGRHVHKRRNVRRRRTSGALTPGISAGGRQRNPPLRP